MRKIYFLVLAFLKSRWELIFDYINQGLLDVLVYQDNYFKQQMIETTDSGTYTESGTEAKKYYKIQELKQSIIANRNPDENTKRLWASFEINNGADFEKPCAYYFLNPDLYAKVEPDTYSYGAPLIMLNKDNLDDILARG